MKNLLILLLVLNLSRGDEKPLTDYKYRIYVRDQVHYTDSFRMDPRGYMLFMDSDDNRHLVPFHSVAEIVEQ